MNKDIYPTHAKTVYLSSIIENQTNQHLWQCKTKSLSKWTVFLHSHIMPVTKRTRWSGGRRRFQFLLSSTAEDVGELTVVDEMSGETEQPTGIVRWEGEREEGPVKMMIAEDSDFINNLIAPIWLFVVHSIESIKLSLP